MIYESLNITEFFDIFFSKSKVFLPLLTKITLETNILIEKFF